MLYAVTFHYVRGEKSAFPELPFKGLSVDEFVKRLDMLQERFEVTTLGEALQYLNGESVERDLCLLTFDDGLAEHYSVVAPILEERGLHACLFFVPTLPLESAQLFSTSIRRTCSRHCLGDSGISTRV